MAIKKLIAQFYEAFSGDTAVFNCQVLNENGVAKDITGASARFVVSRQQGQTTPDIDVSVGTGIVITDATNGRMQITLSNNATAPLRGAYRFELQVTDIAGRVSTVAFGTITFIHDTA